MSHGELCRATIETFEALPSGSIAKPDQITVRCISFFLHPGPHVGSVRTKAALIDEKFYIDIQWQDKFYTPS